MQWMSGCKRRHPQGFLRGGAVRSGAWLRYAAAALLLVASSARAEPCCGSIQPTGRMLAAFLDRSGVDHLWQAGWHVDWRTGEKDRDAPGGPEAATHCSAFAAAMADRLGIYLLRPPEHAQALLANAQMRWLREKGVAYGWRPLASAEQAQEAANGGALVLAVFENPDRHRPGHIAVVRPSDKDRAALDRDGPQETQAGEVNAISTTVREGFAHHRGAWQPNGVGTMAFYVHSVDWQSVESKSP